MKLLYICLTVLIFSNIAHAGGTTNGVERGRFTTRIVVPNDANIARIEYGQIKEKAILDYVPQEPRDCGFENGYPKKCVGYEQVKADSLQVTFSVNGNSGDMYQGLSDGGRNLVINIPTRHFNPEILKSLPMSKNRKYIESNLITTKFVVEQRLRGTPVGQPCGYKPDTNEKIDPSCVDQRENIWVNTTYLVIESK